MGNYASIWEPGTIALLCGAILVSHSTNTYANECSTIYVGGTNNWFPVTYFNEETQTTEGIANDLVTLIGDNLGIPVIINIEVPWSRMLHTLTLGEIDMASAIYWTQERSNRYIYTESYFINEARVFVKKGNEFKFEKFEDLIGLTGGIPSGGSFGDAFDTFAKNNSLDISGVSTKEQRAKMLLLERTDYFIQAHIDGLHYINNNGLQDKIVALPKPVSKTEVYFAISRLSPCAKLVPEINDIINLFIQDGTLQDIIDKYIH